MSKTMLYKNDPKSQVVIWGVPMRIKTVNDEDIADNLAEGWKKHPHDIFEDEKKDIDEEVIENSLMGEEQATTDTPVIDSAAEEVIDLPKAKKK